MTGSGTLLDPYVIWDVNDLQNMSLDLTAYYELGQDIDASATVGWNLGEGFAPVETFTGHFDGKGFTIDQLFINRIGGAVQYVGLFGEVNAGAGDVVIQNVTLTNFNITGTRRVAALASSIGHGAGGSVLISDCHSINGTITSVEILAGGLIGASAGTDTTIDSCTSSGTVTSQNNGDAFVGGLIGRAGVAVGGPTVRFCYSSATVAATAALGTTAGGLIGSVNGAIVSRCYATGNVSGRHSIGGLAGAAGISAVSSISDCYARGAVTATLDRAGGLVGRNGQGAVSDIDNCYSTGFVTGGAPSGGLIGMANLGAVTDSFWDTQTSGQAASAGGTGKTTAEMKTESTFTDAGWDFATIWNILPATNDGYPYLRGVGITLPAVTTDSATNVLQSTATLNGTLDDDGGEACDCGFEWGETVAYGNTTPTQSRTTSQTFSQPIGALSPGTTYHFRAFATNSVGTSYGADESFTPQELLSINRAYALAREEL